MTAPALEARFRVRVGRGESVFEVDAELALERGVLILFGPSGAGKTLTLSALAGLVRPIDGRICVRGRTLFDAATKTHVRADRRRIGYVPQHHSLFPFLDVAANVAFGLPRRERRPDNPRVREIMAEVGLTHLASARPASLSGGERQRVALARALVVAPDLLLLDEPFASIDRAGRQALRQTLREVLAVHDVPAVFVTHSRVEALALGDRVALLERGRTVGSGGPEELLQRPVVRVRGRVVASDVTADGRRLRLADAELELPADALPDVAEGPLDLTVPWPTE